MTHELKVWFKPRVASRLTALTGRDSKGEEIIINLQGRVKKFTGKPFQHFLNWLDAEKYAWELIRTKE